VYTLEIPFHSRQSAVKTFHQFLNSWASRIIPEFSQKNFDVRRTNSLLNKTLPCRLHAINLEENPTSTDVWIFVMRRRRSLHACYEESGIVGTVIGVERRERFKIQTGGVYRDVRCVGCYPKTGAANSLHGPAAAAAALTLFFFFASYASASVRNFHGVCCAVQNLLSAFARDFLIRLAF
jgi:hypothetical protein